MSWREIFFGDAIHIKHGYAFKSQYFSDIGLFMLLTPGNFHEKGGFRIRPAKERFYTGDFPGIFLLNKGDLIVAMTEQGAGLIGSSAWIPESGKYLHNQRLGKIDEIDESILNKKFLYHLFNTYTVRAQISGSATGTKVRHTAPERIYKVKVRIPNVISQVKIASTFDVYDGLIENNRRRIQLLEESARLLYKEWFVNFRFPGHENIKIVNGVPEGWERKPLVEVAHLTMGQSPKSEFYNAIGDGLPFHQGVTNYGERFVSHKIYSTKITRLAESGDILCSVRAPVGRLNYTLDKIILGRGLCAISSKFEHQSFLFYQLKNYFFKEDIIGSGAIYAAVTKKDMETLELLKPSVNIVRSFEEISRPFDKQIKNLSEQNQKLAEACDLLLPRLMNGEIEV